jgi:hypothetical protein
MIYIADNAAQLKITGAQAARDAGNGEESLKESK